MNTSTVVEALRQLMGGDFDDSLVMELGESVCETNTFAEFGLMTRDDGLVLRMDDGSEFQLTVVQSKRAN